MGLLGKLFGGGDGEFDPGQQRQTIDIPQKGDPQTKSQAAVRFGTVGRNSIRHVTGRGTVHDDPDERGRR